MFRMTFENVSISGEKEMGFLGGTFLYDTRDWFAIGPGVYGAATGNRPGTDRRAHHEQFLGHFDQHEYNPDITKPGRLS